MPRAVPKLDKPSAQKSRIKGYNCGRACGQKSLYHGDIYLSKIGHSRGVYFKPFKYAYVSN